MYTRVGVRGWWVGKGSVVGRGFCFMMKGSGVVCKELYQDKPVRIVNLGYQVVKFNVKSTFRCIQDLSIVLPFVSFSWNPAKTYTYSFVLS